MILKIEINIDIDVKKIFRDIPKNLFKESSCMITDKNESNYLIEAINSVLSKPKSEILMGRMEMLANSSDMIKFTEHHYQVELEIAKQLLNFKIKE